MPLIELAPRFLRPRMAADPAAARDSRRQELPAHRGSSKLAMVSCMLTGHVVAWGPCDRCHRRAPG